ncbi:MAG: hypothetical protein R3F53_03470 [Gammaproteobacteria bacterium]
MMDAVLGLTALSKVFPAGKLCQTVEFKINYLRSVTPGTSWKAQAKSNFPAIGCWLLQRKSTIWQIDVQSPGYGDIFTLPA